MVKSRCSGILYVYQIAISKGGTISSLKGCGGRQVVGANPTLVEVAHVFVSVAGQVLLNFTGALKKETLL